jgi:hypothetical protein
MTYDSVNDILLICKASNGSNPFFIVDLKEYYNKINNEIDLSDLSDYLQVTQIEAVNSLANWKPYTQNNYPMNGTKVKWSSNKGLFCWMTPTSASTNNIITSSNGLHWSYSGSGTSLIVYDMCETYKQKNNTYFATSTPSFIYNPHDLSGGSQGGSPTYNTITSTVTHTSMFYAYKYDLVLAFKNTSSNTFSVLGDQFLLYTNYLKLPSSIIYGGMEYSSELDLFVILPASGTDTYFYSSNIYEWNTGTLPVTSGITSITYSNKLKMFVAAATSGIILSSTDGINWTQNSLLNGISITQVSFINDLEIFVLSTSTPASVNSLYYSVDGINWVAVTLPSSVSIYSFAWSPKTASFCIISGTSTYMLSVPVLQRSRNGLLTQSMSSSLTTTTNFVESGIQHIFTPQSFSRPCIYQGTSNANYDAHLFLSGPTAYKPTSTAWTISSDERIKENIELADLNICYNNIKNLELKKYKWKDDYIEQYKIEDQNKLGWIAQDVEQFYPKSVSTRKILDIEDCKSLDTDQIITGLYGSIQKLCNKYKDLENKLN